ncbi:hypothetical protein Tco_0565299 [Tanacetum coccineum]
MDQLQKQLDKDEFQEDGFMAAFLKQESKVDIGKALDADLVVTESSGTKSGKHNTSSRPGNDTDADNADTRPIYDEEPMTEVQLTVECNIFDIRQHHTEQPELNNEGRVDHDAVQCQVKSPLLDPSPHNKTTEFSNQSLESENIFKENETLKKHYKELYDSIKTTRAKTIEHTTSLIAQNVEFKAQLQEKRNSDKKQGEKGLDILNSKGNFKPHTTTSIKVPTVDMIVMTSMTELESLFVPLFDEYFNKENQVVSKYSDVTTADASDKRQQQPDSTSSTSTLATTVTADGNFDL